MLCAKILNAQWQEDFSSSLWHLSWKGDISNFIVNSDLELQSKAQPAATIAISRASDVTQNVVWEFDIRLSVKLASNNLARVYLTSNQEDLKSALQGYYVEISGTGRQFSYFLKKQNGNRSVVLIQSDKLRTPNQISASIRVVRNADAEWFFYVKDPLLADAYKLLGSKLDHQFLNGNYFGVWYKFSTLARSNRLYFDNIKINFFERDTIPPQITSVQVNSPTSLRLRFSELMDSLRLLNPEFYLLNGNRPHAIKINTLDDIELHFDTLQTQHYQLKVTDVTDKSGNELSSGYLYSFFHIQPYEVKFGDVRINEIMFKPDTAAGLPNAEYVELWNTTSKYILLNGWKWSDKTRTVSLRTDTLAPLSYLILCPSAMADAFSSFGKVHPLRSFPSLNNDGELLKLENSENVILDSVAYSPMWLNDRSKIIGGVALEWTGNTACSAALSWTASGATIGGTPGSQNSVFQWSKKPIRLLSSKVLSDTTMSLQFNQRLDTAMLSFQMEPYSVSAKYTDLDSLMNIQIRFDTPVERGRQHVLYLNNVSNCEHTVAAIEIPFFKAFEPQANEILISEVMVYPSTNGASYVELFNATDKVFNLKDVFIANQNSEGMPMGVRSLGSTDRWFAPQTYLTFTKDSTFVSHQYTVAYPHQLIQLPSLPSYASRGGSVWVLNSKLETIDKFDYTAELHNNWLKNTRNVALERVSFDKNTNAPGNFISAAADIGFGTPTYANSTQGLLASKLRFWLGSKTLSPDNDGFEDVLEINYELNSHEWMGQMEVYDALGNFIAVIYPNASLSSKGMCVWNPQRNAQIRLNQGIYVVIVKLFSPNGKQQVFRLPFAVVYKN